MSLIIWPDRDEDKIIQFLNFSLHLTASIGIDFSELPVDPVNTVQSFLQGDMSDSDVAEKRNIIWSYLERHGSVREFSNKTALKARYAICLLSAQQAKIDELDPTLEWLLEVVNMMVLNGHLKVTEEELTHLVTEHFELSS